MIAFRPFALAHGSCTTARNDPSHARNHASCSAGITASTRTPFARTHNDVADLVTRHKPGHTEPVNTSTSRAGENTLRVRASGQPENGGNAAELPSRSTLPIDTA